MLDDQQAYSESKPCEDMSADDIHSLSLNSGDDTGYDSDNSKVLVDHDISSLSVDTTELSASEYHPWKNKEAIFETIILCSEIDFDNRNLSCQ